VVRQATAADVEAVRTVAIAAWRATYRELIPRRAIERFLERAYAPERVALRIERHDVLVAGRSPASVRDGAPVGAHVDPAIEAFAECAPEDGHLQLIAIYTLPRARSRGLGSALLDGVLERHPGLDVAADVLTGNVRGEPFYAARGFSPGESLEEELAGTLVTERRWWLRRTGSGEIS
jgi:GNAT superfamily N-acetyltransferase